MLLVAPQRRVAGIKADGGGEGVVKADTGKQSWRPGPGMREYTSWVDQEGLPPQRP